MNNTKHTPGPWKVEIWSMADHDALMITGSFIRIACVSWDSNDRENPFVIPQDEAKANAALISAAPDLLEALQGWADEQSCVCEEAELEPDTCLYCATLAAIAKATPTKEG